MDVNILKMIANNVEIDFQSVTFVTLPEQHSELAWEYELGLRIYLYPV